MSSTEHAMIFVKGAISSQVLKFLLDTGATHNFLPMTTARELRLPISTGVSNDVRLADGSTVSCSRYADALVSFGVTQQVVRF